VINSASVNIGPSNVRGLVTVCSSGNRLGSFGSAARWTPCWIAHHGMTRTKKGATSTAGPANPPVDDSCRQRRRAAGKIDRRSTIISSLELRVKREGGMHQPDRERRRRLGSYGAGTLWCLRSRSRLVMLFDDRAIAKRGRPGTRAWLALDASWIVTSLQDGQVLVQRDDDEGVAVSLRGGGK
jgi:hypothetical protein